MYICEVPSLIIRFIGVLFSPMKYYLMIKYDISLHDLSGSY